MLRSALVVASAILTLASGSAQANPFSLDDLFHLERIGHVAISPLGRTVVFEQFGPMTQNGPYQYDALSVAQRSSLHILSTSTGERSLHPPIGLEGRGLMIGSWAPTDDRLLVYRLKDQVFSAGVLDTVTGRSLWLSGVPELALWGRSAQWRDADALVMIQRTQGDMPPLLRVGVQPEQRLAQLWDMTRQGEETGRTMIGGGSFLHLNPKPEDSRLVLVSAVTGATHVLAAGRFHDLEVAPGGRFAAAVRFTSDRPFDASQPFLQGEFTERRELTLADLETGEVWEPIPGEDLIPHLLSWSPSGNSLIVWARTDGVSWAQGRLLRIDPRSRTVTRIDLSGFEPALVQTGLRTPVVCADWLGEQLVLYVENGDRKDWALLSPGHGRILTKDLTSPSSGLLAISRDRIVVQAEGDAWSVDLLGHAKRLGRAVRTETSLTAALFNEGQRFQFNNAPRRDWVMVGDGDQRRRTRTGSGDFFGSVADATSPIVALGETTFVRRDIDAVFREGLAIDQAQPFIRLNSFLSEVSFSTPEAVHDPAGDGRAVIGWLYRPPSERLVFRPPLIVIPYPGSSARAPRPIDDMVMANVQLMVSAGYAVLIPSLPRSNSRGEPAQDMAKDILAVVDATEASNAFDPDKIVLWGHSFGAFGAVAAATQSDRFAAVIAANGPYDLASVWGQFPLAASLMPEEGLSVRSRAGWVETGQGGLGAPPFADPDRYVRNSPVFQADRISAPMLLFTGDRDYIPSGQAEELFSALYRQEKDVVLVTYRGEGHVLSSPANIRALYETIWQWLDQVLGTPPTNPRRFDSAQSVQ